MDVKDILELLVEKKRSNDRINPILWVMAIVGAIASLAGICYAVYRYFTPNYLEDFNDEDFEDDFDDYFDDDDFDEPKADQEEAAEEPAAEEPAAEDAAEDKPAE